jgi:hypothetical protein
MRRTLLFGAALALAACTAHPKQIPQPVVEGLKVAPNSARVDITVPKFTHPTRVTNPLFPVSKQASVLMLGHVEGKPFRTEVTLLPYTRVITWQGQQIETLVSQYVAYLGGRIEEVAYDLYAQDDGGAVWYFGEDVFDFKDGVIINTEGTWTAGRDGPPALIMPAHPKVGDVYRSENIPGLVFEQVTVKAVDRTLDGPLGTIRGGLIGTELHMEGDSEDKIFAPGYGEFRTSGGGDLEALALAVPTDAASGPAPAYLGVLRVQAARAFDAAASGSWSAASAASARMATSWGSRGRVPRMIEPRMSESLRELETAVRARSAPETRQAALDVTQWTLDLQLRYQPEKQIDWSRFDRWCAQLVLDAGARDAGAINGDYFALDYIRDRVADSLSGLQRTRFNARLGELLTAVTDNDFKAAASLAERLRDEVRGLTGP